MEKIKTFKKVNDKVIMVEKPRYVSTGLKADFNTKKAKKMINDTILDMGWEIRQSEKTGGDLIFDDYGRVSHRTKVHSSFPEYMREAGITSKKDFMKVIKQKKGIRKERLKKIAMERLVHGYQNDHGYDGPNIQFKVASKQIYDNEDIIFRRIRGRIVPIKVSRRDRYDLITQKDIDSVPF